MMLSDRDILSAMDDGDIEIRPFDKKRLGPNSVDLTLGNHLLVYTDRILDSCKMNPYQYITIPDEGLCLLPGELYLGFTNEFTSTQGRLVPQLEGKSSIARLGMSVHLTAGFGDCGFEGHWTLEITVVRPIKVYANMPIAQIFYLQLKSAPLIPYNEKVDSKYNNQEKKPVVSAMWKNF